MRNLNLFFIIPKTNAFIPKIPCQLSLISKIILQVFASVNPLQKLEKEVKDGRKLWCILASGQ